MRKFNRNPLTQSISMALLGSVVTATVVMPVHAQDEDSAVLAEVIVTATKREQNLQDVALLVQVLGNQQLEELNVRSFEDFVHFMPTVSYTAQGGPGGPGFGQVYMRGIASGGDGNHSASMPSVGYYLDEQPVTTINQVLDIHMYDIARVETLAGPQGTLYGQGSQSGTAMVIAAILSKCSAISRKVSVGTPAEERALKSRKIPTRKPKSPMRFTMKALLPQ